MAKHQLELRNVRAEAASKPILRGVSLTIHTGELHVVMGPNGSGKSTLCHVVMGHPNYKITEGDILFDGQSILTLTPDKRAQLGLFLGFQYPRELPGVTYGNFLRLAKNAILKAQTPGSKGLSPAQFMPLLKQHMATLDMKTDMLGRAVNEGFSGGEKKKAEMLQLAVLAPHVAVLDEIDSGLDIDAMKIVARGIQTVMQETGTGMLLITHYQRLLDQLTPTAVYVMVQGKIVATGGNELITQLEKSGYAAFQTA